MKGCIVPILLIVAVLVVFFKRHEIIQAFRGEPTVEPLGEVVALPETDEAIRSIPPEVRKLLSAELSALDLQLGDPIFIRIFKETRELEVWVRGRDQTEFELYKTMLVCEGAENTGPKSSGAGSRAPEGFYYVSPRHLRPRSRYHFAFDLGYPNRYDRERGRSGSPSYLRGACKGDGSYALTDANMEELYLLAWHAFKNGQPFFRVHCFPFRMTDQRMDEVVDARSEWLDFWANLKEGYDFFEILRYPPNTTLREGNYCFE